MSAEMSDHHDSDNVGSQGDSLYEELPASVSPAQESTTPILVGINDANRHVKIPVTQCGSKQCNIESIGPP